MSDFLMNITRHSLSGLRVGVVVESCTIVFLAEEGTSYSLVQTLLLYGSIV